RACRSFSCASCESVGWRGDFARADLPAGRLTDRRRFPRPQDVARAVRDVGPLIVGGFRLVGLLCMGAVWRPEHPLVVADQLCAGGGNLMADRLSPTPEQEIDEIHTISIGRILLRDGEADAQAGHSGEQHLVVCFSSLCVYVGSHGISTEDNFMPMRTKPLFKSFSHFWK